MPLDKPGLKSDILDIFDNLAQREEKPEDAREALATMLADAIDKFVKTGTVHVTTTGSATTQTGTGTIS